MNVKTIGFITAGVALAATVATTVCASAAPARLNKGTAHLIVYSADSDGPDYTAIATGAVGDYGPGVTVLPNGSVDPEHRSELQLNLKHGSFRLGIAGIHADLAKDKWRWNTANCSGSISFTALAPVVAGSGTGAYRGITGSFSMTVSIDEVDVKPSCDGTSAFLSQVILMDGTGTVSY